jgi:tape measure domain-containing protein|nr:MAG TPA: tail tape measure protein [Bacteriophage sp.]
MNSVDGALAFKATLDIDQFNVSAQAMERNIRRVSDTAVSESAEMEQSILSFAQNGARYIVSYLVGQGMGSLLQSIVSVRGQFQQLEIAFETMLGSGSKAKALMDQMAETAAKTPFDLQGVAGGAKQLLAYGESADKVNDTLVRLGNIASGLSIPLNDIVYLYGTTMVQGRLYAQDVRQFTGRGIPLVKELAAMYGKTAEEINAMVSEGKIGFPEVEKVIKKLTDQGGQFYNLMEKQSASLTGQISNLGDAWDMALNKIGERNQEVFSTGISGATYLVEHLDDVLRIVKSVAIAYGSYRAAVILNTLATKGYTGVSLIDNTVRQAKIALLKTDDILTGKVAAQTKAMNIAEEAHTASLQKQLTAEELVNLQKKLRISIIQGLLTAQQQEYLSNLNLTASSAGYESAALSVLSVEQREALGKVDLSAKSSIYRAALEQEVATKNSSQAATISAMRSDVSAAAAKVEAAKQTAIASMQATEAARYEVYWAKQSGDATRIATAEKRLEGAQDNQATARKAALAAQTDFYAKKKALETAATRQSTVASTADAAAKTVQGTTTSILTTITTRATVAMKALWTSMMSNPIGWILGLVGALVSVFTLFRSKEEETTDAMGEFNKTTKDEINNLDVLFTILSNTDRGTQTHRQTIEKINAVCKEYNKTLLDENATLDIQKLKYEELSQAIQETTAEKIKAKYAEIALQEQIEASNKSLDKLKSAASSASYTKIELTALDAGDGKSIQGYGAVEHQSQNIRNASAAVWEMVETDAMEAAKRLQSLTGDAYTAAFNQVLAKITERVQKATGATSDEMDTFEASLSTYLSEVTTSSKKATEEIGRLDKQLEAYLGEKDTPIVASVDYVSMSFGDLEKQIKDAQAEIDVINKKTVKVDADTTRLKELSTLISTIQGAVTTKTNNLNTEAGISARIKELKDERANVAINSTKYKEYTKTIESLEKKLPKHKTGGDSDGKDRESLRQKQLEADRKLEEARISVMEDGYEKRKAILDLQHKKNLEQIDKEERDLEEARKKAGKGGLSQSEKDGFNERRNLENQSFTKSQASLFDGEVEYKKKQYELYFRWVKNMGQEVADAHFSTLLQSGSSYKDYVEREIQKLKDKQSTGTLSDGESNQLITLNMQYNEITGAKSAMDTFRESVTSTINQAATLAEKLEAVAQAKANLENGSSGLVGGDEQAAGLLFVTEEEEKIQKEIQERVLNDFRSYEEQKKGIQDEYGVLRLEAMRMQDEERINQINKAESEALSALNASYLMQSESWKNLFTDLDSLTVDQIDKLITDIQSKMNTADLNLNPADMKAVLDKLDEAKKKILDVNPFKALGNAISSVFSKSEKGSKKTSKEIKTDWNNLANATEGVFDFVNDAIDSCDVLGDLIGETGKSTINMVQGIATAGIAMSAAIKTAEKGSVILAAISIALQAIQWIAGLFNNDDELEEKIQKIQRNIDALSNSFDRLQHASEQTYWVFSDEEKAAHDKRLQSIKDQIDALEQQKIVAQQSWDFVKYAQLTKQIKDLKYALEKESNKGDMFQLYEAQKQNLKEQQRLIQEQIKAEKEKKKTDRDKIAEWEEAIKDIDTQLEDMERDMLESLAGTDIQSAIDDFASALVDAYCQGEDAAKALGDVTKSVLKNAVVEALKRQFLAKAINDAVLYLGEAMEDGDLSDAEKKRFEDMVNKAGDKFYGALEAVGDWIKDDDAETPTDPLTGAVTSMSEETGGVIAGRLNAFVINQSEQISIGREQLVYQAEIAANTRASATELTEIKETLKRIESKDNSLLSQGIS